jgi:hypothetical protein
MSQPFIELKTIKVILQGALGAMTFGAYNSYSYNKVLELNNESMNIKHNSDMNSMKLKHENDFAIMDIKYKSELAFIEMKHKQEVKEFQEKFEKVYEKLEQIEKNRNWW